MIRLIVMVLCVWSGLSLLPSLAEGPQEKGYPPYTPRLAVPGEPIAGIPQEEALKIFGRYEKELRELPGSISVSFYADGIVVETANPKELPTAVEGLPVIPVPPVDPAARAAIGLEPLPPDAYPLPDRPKLAHPDSQPCPSGTFRVPGEGRCRRLNPPPADPAPELKLLPPPSGVIVLKPGKVREQADSCPEEFKEVEGYGGWRFCVDPQKPEPIPPLWSPPVAGIPYEDVLVIHDRHALELSKLPGVKSVGLGADGIHISTSRPELVPKEVEGVPIIVEPAPEGSIQLLSHTFNTPVRPLHGGIFISQNPVGFGVLTGVALSQGYPWLIFPAHLIQTCDISPPCPITPNNPTPLNSCSHYPQPGQTIPVVVQPPAGSPSLVGFAQRWTPLSNTVTSNDVAAAYMDDNLVERDGSLLADRRVETADSTSIPFSGEPIPVLPPSGLPVTMRAALGPPHSIPLRVRLVNQLIPNVQQCAGQSYSLVNQITYEPNPPDSLIIVQLGDSGSPVFDGAGRLLGMMNWCFKPTGFDNCGCVPLPGQTTCIPNAGGTSVFGIKGELTFDTWYGTNTSDLSASLWPTPFSAVTAGQWACTFAQVKNTGTVTAQQVAVANDTTIAQQPLFGYYNPNNQWNTPYDIPPGQTVLFAPCFFSYQPLPPINWHLNYYGTNAAAPVIKAAYNTYAIVWGASPTPSFHIGANTFSGDDIVHTGGPSGLGYFSVPLTNVGAAENVTITLDTDWGYGSLPYTLTVCELNSQAQCIAPPSATRMRFFNVNESAWYLVVVQGQGQAVTLDPYYHRVFFRVRNGVNQPNGTMIGAIGLSVTTN